MAVVCPRCGTTNDTQAVSAIVAAGTSYMSGVTNSFGTASTRFSDGVRGRSFVSATSRTNATTQTGIAGMLNLPRIKSGPGMWITGVLLVILGIGTWALFYGVIAAQKHDPDNPMSQHALAVVSALFVSCLFWLPGLILLFAGLRRRRRFKRDAPVRQHMAMLWQNATYCHRDDVVFLPDGTWSTPHAFRMMLRDQASRAISQARP